MDPRSASSAASMRSRSRKTGHPSGIERCFWVIALMDVYLVGKYVHDRQLDYDCSRFEMQQMVLFFRRSTAWAKHTSRTSHREPIESGLQALLLRKVCDFHDSNCPGCSSTAVRSVMMGAPPFISMTIVISGYDAALCGGGGDGCKTRLRMGVMATRAIPRFAVGYWALMTACSISCRMSCRAVLLEKFQRDVTYEW
jgi:hypothetical protein